MLNRVRFLIAFGLVLAACAPSETARLRPGASGDAGTNGGAGTGPAGGAGTSAAGGTTGQAGDTAISGNAGTTGQAGTNGEAGTTGQAGTTAQAGTTGQAGTTAAAGTTGQAGTTAAAGTTGQAGTTAAAGTSGQAGTTAAAGTSGQAGTGAAGTSASPGTFTNYCSPVHWTLTSMPVNAADPAANAADGNIASRWSTGVPQAVGQYLQVDFGGTVSLTQVVIDNSNPPHIADYPRGYDVQLSANGTAFTSVKTGAPTAGGVITADFAAAQGRYLRISQTGTGAGAAWWSVDEVRVACTVPGKPAGAIDPYDPTNWTATASKSAGASGPAKAIDGDASTRWATGGDQVGGETFTLDIGAAAMVSELWLDGGGAADFPAMYKLEVSVDGTNYTQVATGAGALVTKIVFTRQNARYFRITQTGAANKWWSIYAVTLKP